MEDKVFDQRLETATKILAALLIEDRLAWCKDGDAWKDQSVMINQAVELADRLIARINSNTENHQEQSKVFTKE